MITIYDNKTIQKCFYTSKTVNRNIEKHSHFFWEFTYCIDGGVSHQINGNSIKAHAFSEIILIKPKDTHQITLLEKNLNQTTYHRDIYVTPEKMKRCCDFLSPALYNELLKKDLIILDGKHEHLENLEYSLKLFEKYNTYLKSELDILEKVHTSIVFQILSMYYKQFLQKPTYPAWINSFFAKLKNEEYLCQNVENLTKDLNYSHAYLCREFKKHTGKTMVSMLKRKPYHLLHSTLT